MAIKFHTPTSVSFAGKYSLGAEVPDGARLFFVSGLADPAMMVEVEVVAAQA